MSSIRFAASLLVAAALSAADHVWIEGEAPVLRPELPAGVGAGAVKYGDAWGMSSIMSDGKLLHLHVPDGEVEKHIPEGLTFGYDATLSAAGAHEVWARIGYETVRSPIRWRAAGGAWQECPPEAMTVDVMPIQTWNELAWINLGTIEAKPGTLRIEIMWPRPERLEKDKTKVGRILGMLDALCLAKPGSFRPNGKWQPGSDHGGEDGRAATAQLFTLPAASAAGVRSSVELTGAWQMAHWEETAEPTDRLGAPTALPDAAKLDWFAYRVPGDRNSQRPDAVFQHRFIARCRVDVPAAHAGRAFELDLERFTAIATVFINGVQVGHSTNHSTGWRLDVTKGVKPGQVNEIAVVIKDRYYGLVPEAKKPRGWFAFRNLPVGFLTDNQGVGSRYELPIAAEAKTGLTEPVTLSAVGPAYVADAFVKTSVQQKRIAVETTLCNPGAARTVSVQLAAVPWSADGAAAAPAKTIAPVQVALAAGETKTIEIADAWADARLWWPDDVQLYELVATVSEGGRPIDVSRTRFGFREWSWQGDRFSINGVPWSIHGDIDANYDPKRLVAQRVQSGQNTLRLWTFGGMAGMTRKQTLRYCDEQGIIVRSSGIFDGQLANYGGGLVEEVEVNGKKQRQAKAILFANWRNQLAAWVKTERNHPSVMIWSVENEITYINSANLGMADHVEPAISDAIRNVVMKTDPTRPAMVDGGNALKDESLPVNGAHYTEMYNSHWRDQPDASYDSAPWYLSEHKSRNMWRYAPGKPVFKGEVFFANGYSTESFATIGGERCFIGVGEVGEGVARLGQIFNEGWRWSGVAAWQHWLGGASGRYWNGWQPIAVLCRQWNTTFGAGQQVERQLRVLNNTSKGDPITVTWELQLEGAKIAGEAKTFTVAPGAHADWAIAFAIPSQAKAKSGRFVLTATRGGAEVFRDERAVRVLAPAALAKPRLAAAELAVYDPKGQVRAYLTARGIAHTATASLDEIPAGAKVLLIGPDAIPAERATDPLWYERAVRGLKVVVLDQRHPLRYRALPADLEPLDDKPTVWAQMQAKAAGVQPELRGRYGFAEDLNHPALAGLVQEDFYTWSGDHVVYRNPYRKGTKGFRSLFQCEEGLSATALAECQTGEGLLLLCQLAVGEKIATDPVAQQLLVQMITHAATYAPVRRQISAVAGAQIAGLLGGIGVQHRMVADPLAAIASDGIAVVEATPSALKSLAAKADQVRAWCAKGNWLMLWGVTPEGLADFNTLVRWNHVLRPFDTERVLMAVPADPLTAGLTLRDVVLDTGKQMYPWMALKKPDSDSFTWIVDHTDIAPFCVFPSPTALGKKSDTNPGADHWPRNMVNGFTSADNWSFCYTVIMDQGHKTRWTLELPKEEELIALKIQPSRIYHPITRIDLYFDEDPVPVPVELRIDPVAQEIAFPPRKAKRVTMQVAAWAERGDANIVVIDNLWLIAKRPEDYLTRVKPLLNVGGLVRYDEGKGGIVLNQLKLLEREVNPVNAEKKATVAKTILANLGAVFAGQKTVVAGSQLRYAPLALPVEKCTAYVNRDKQPAWWNGPADLTGLPVGEQTFAGTRFLLPKFTTSPVPTAFMLRGRNASVKNDRIDGLPVGTTADALFFLHTFNENGDLARRLNEMRERRADGKDPGEYPVVLTYHVTYADGQTAEVPVRYSRDIGNWLSPAPAGLANAAVAWSAPAGGDQQVVVWSMQWTNPRPEAQIASVDLVAGEAKWGSAAVFAITAATVAR